LTVLVGVVGNDVLKTNIMSGEARTATRFIEEVLGTGDWSRAEEVLQPDVVLYHPSAPEPIRGHDAVKSFLNMFRSGMPDLHLTVDDVAGDGERVATRWSAEGTHTAEMFGLPPTGKRVDIHGISFFRFVDGRIVEDWVEENTLSVLQQLGALPALG
jgi:steroid delta-isomerase-like uncharacterized protein